ncbi:hypothetical protein OsI_28458 [Oryza sativa Indica Group]|uniref:Uncharacterized protein n=1 Tax=Oryza sativa subsp. indica TaxID=39946 RepID=B8B8R5_ORYSI|nr:hypothetical protein OsI_28458 [Oryza sativa Indica Group]
MAVARSGMMPAGHGFRKGKASAVEEVNGFFMEEEEAVSDASSIGVASSDSSTGELVVREGGAFSSLQAAFKRK